MTLSDPPGKAHNPFVGPRAFRQGEQLYGRDREVLDLLDLLIAERIVLLYSPSGAGKTSLINAGLIPSLQDEGFGVLPVVRVGLDPDGDRAGAAGNRYLASTLLSLERDVPAGSQQRTAALGETSLGAYLERRGPVDGRDHHVLIVDALEELLTLDPTDRAAKERFMAELGDALRDGRRWALFALREDYLGQLEPFVRYVPTRLATTFRLNLLEAPAARAAMQSPVSSAGVAFLDAAAEKLVDNLRRVRVQRPEGRVEEAGPYVEPVQLQVVCRRLWDRLPTGATEIGTSDVDAVGDVDRALADYYAEQVAGIADRTRIPERTIREWFDRELITGQGFRAQVLEGPDGDDDRQALRLFEDAHLVRAEQRRGATWFELTHDRLVQPIRTDNAAWRERNLTALQRQAVLWDEQRRGEGLLLRGDALMDAERLLQDEPVELSDTEDEFLAACRALAVREREAARRQRWLRWLTVGLAVLLVLTLVAAAAALQQRNRVQVASERASAAARLATSRQLTAESAAALDSDPRTALLLGIAAERIHGDAENRSSLANSLIATRYAGTLSGHRLSVNSVAFSPDGRTLATASGDRTVRLWDLSAWGRPVQLGQPLTGHHDAVASVAFSPDGRILATASKDRTVRLWDVRRRADPVPLGQPLTGHRGGVYSVAFSRDGDLLATAGHDGALLLWRVRDPTRPRRLGTVLAGRGGHVWSVAFGPDGRTLAAGTEDRTVRVWDVARPDRPVRGRKLGGHRGPVTAVAFSPDGRLLASASTDHQVRLWDLRRTGPARPDQVLAGHSAAVYSVAFGRDGRTLASGGYDTTTIVWRASRPGRFTQLGRPLTGHDASVNSVAFSPDGRTLASASTDGTTSLEDLVGHRADPARVGPPLRGHGAEVASVAFSPDGRTVASGSADQTVILWAIRERPSRGRPPPERALPAQLGHPLEGHRDEVASVAFSPDGRYLATGSVDHTAMIWDVRDRTHPARVGPALNGHEEAVTSVAFSPDGRTLATGGDDRKVILWDVSDPLRPALIGAPLAGYGDAVTSVAFSPDGRYLATGSDDKTAVIWDLRDVRHPARAGPELASQQGVASVAFSPDGRTLATGGDDAAVTLWAVDDPADPARLGPPLKGHDAPVASVAFSPDGHTLASGGDDRKVVLWDLSNPARRARIGAPLVGHEEAVTSVAFGPDGHFLVTGGDDGTLILWDLTELNAIRNYPRERACALTGRGLDRGEWARYVPGLPYEDTCPNRP